MNKLFLLLLQGVIIAAGLIYTGSYTEGMRTLLLSPIILSLAF